MKEEIKVRLEYALLKMIIFGSLVIIILSLLSSKEKLKLCEYQLNNTQISGGYVNNHKPSEIINIK